jgi:nitrile hydratase accessory protein
MSTSGRAILSRPDALLPRERRGDGPIFAEAWHADALAIAIVLTRRGVFSAAEWSAALGAAIRASQARGEPDDEEHYYEAVLTALESLIDRALPEVGSAIAPRVEQWRRAYLRTPHGQPVELQAGANPE